MVLVVIGVVLVVVVVRDLDHIIEDGTCWKDYISDSHVMGQALGMSSCGGMTTKSTSCMSAGEKLQT